MYCCPFVLSALEICPTTNLKEGLVKLYYCQFIEIVTFQNKTEKINSRSQEIKGKIDIGYLPSYKFSVLVNSLVN